MTITFGELIRSTRTQRDYSQRQLAKLICMDFTYLSKLENNRADYPPKEDVIRALARELHLDAEELIFLSGRVPRSNEDLLRQHYKMMPTLFRRLREDPTFASQILTLAAAAVEAAPNPRE